MKKSKRAYFSKKKKVSYHCLILICFLFFVGVSIPVSASKVLVDNNRKIAKSLRAGILDCIHIPSEESLQDRSLVRTRSMVVRELIRIKLRIKSFLYFYGIKYPPEFSSHHKHWSNGFMRWLKEDIILQYSSGKMSLELLVLEAENKRNNF